ncbi:MAG: adenylate/guanylate cyclase domain-containing protein [Sphingomonadaceae bacterium]
MLQGLDVGVAAAEAPDSPILFENARFFQWFPPGPDQGDSLAGRLSMVDWPRVCDRLERGRGFAQDIEVRAGVRTVFVDLRVRRDRGALIVEAADASKRREAELMLDSYARMAERHAKDLTREKERVERLLLNVMPRSVYEELKEYGTTTPQRFDAASVLMLDFADFTDMAVSRDPGALVAELNDIFSAFDRIVELCGAERIKTIGDAYVAVSGLPEANEDHAEALARVALRMQRYLERRNAAHPTQWRFRIGLASGPVIGSMVGIQKYVYDIFGPAVNLAARMEELAEPMTIRLTAAMGALLGEQFRLESAGTHVVKGFGPMETMVLLSERR